MLDKCLSDRLQSHLTNPNKRTIAGVAESCYGHSVWMQLIQYFNLIRFKNPECAVTITRRQAG